MDAAMETTEEPPADACYHCRLLGLRSQKSGRMVFWCARRKRPVPDFFVWKRCPHFVPPKGARIQTKAYARAA